MSDTVERLRGEAEKIRGTRQASIALEAADEIERLRADKAELLAALKAIRGDRPAWETLEDDIRAKGRAAIARAESK